MADNHYLIKKETLDNIADNVLSIADKANIIDSEETTELTPSKMIDCLETIDNGTVVKTAELNFFNKASVTISPNHNEGEHLFSSVTINKPKDLKSNNIVKDKNIFGITGTHDPDVDLQDKTDTITTNNTTTTYTAGSGYDGLSSVKVTVRVPTPVPPEGAFTIEGPKVSTSASAIIATAKITTSGMLKTEKSDGTENTLSGGLPITVHSGGTRIPTAAGGTIAVAGSTVYYTDNYTLKDEPNLIPENIKDGVTIFNITGTHTCPEPKLLPVNFNVSISRANDAEYSTREVTVGYCKNDSTVDIEDVTWDASLDATTYSLTPSTDVLIDSKSDYINASVNGRNISFRGKQYIPVYQGSTNNIVLSWVNFPD